MTAARDRDGLAEPVKVTFVSSHARLGGSESYLATLLDELGPGWVREIVCLEHGPFVERLAERRYPVHVLPTSAHPLAILRSAWRLRMVVTRERQPLIHANGVKAALVSAIATAGTTTAVLWVKHDFSWDGVLARFVARGCRAIIGVSSAVTETFDEKTRARKVDVVHNGIPAYQVDRKAGRELMVAAVGPPPPSALVALVGRLDPRKGHLELVAAAPRLVQRVPGIRIVFVGGEDPSNLVYAEELRRRVGEAELAASIMFVGHRQDAVEIIAGSDVIAIPSIQEGRFGKEGFPYVGLEAMAVGTPVVGYAHGGLPEMLGECGVLVPPGDHAALGDAIVKLVQDRALREDLGRCGRERVAAQFSIPRMVQEMKTRYHLLAAQPS